ncbi:MAG: hypothetical protein IPN00_10455 [Hydrogenophilales bacterium]|nr:hypothetical protein [Hydrogenophilales bacterium]
MTKQFAGGAERNLWLGWRRTPRERDQARLSRLPRWALDAHAAGLAFGLRLPGRELPPPGGRGPLRACLEALAREARA